MSYFPIRYFVILCLGLVGFVAYFNRSTLEIAIVSMVDRPNATAENPNLCPNPKPNNNRHISRHLWIKAFPTVLTLNAILDSNEHSSGQKYKWSPEVQGVLLSCFYWSYTLLQIPAGYIVSRFGGRIPILIAVFCSAVISASSPFLINFSVYAFVASRVLMGILQSVMFPAQFLLACNWSPVRERSTLIAIAAAGTGAAYVSLSFVSGFLINAFTWTSMFYMPAIFSILGFVVLYVMIRDQPEEHFLVSAEEVSTIRGKRESTETEPLLDSNQNPVPDVPPNESERSEAVPWKGILTNIPVIVWLLQKLCHNLFASLIATEMPTYLVTVLSLDIVTMGMMASAHSACESIVGIGSAFLSEILIQKNICSRTRARKIFSFLNGTVQSTLLVLIPTLRCNRLAVLIAYNISALMGGLTTAADYPMAAEMSPRWPSLLYGLGNFLTCSTSVIVPLVTGFVLGAVRDQWLAWDILFYSAGLISISANILFMFFASADRQEFDLSAQEKEALHQSRTNSQSIN